MLTFQDQYEMAQNISGDSSSAQLILFKSDINEGGAMFLNRLGRKFNREYKNIDLGENQQYYPLPNDVLRVASVRVLNGSTYYTPRLVTSEEEWNDLNAINLSGSIPTHYYIRGFDEIGLFPTPSADLEDGLVLSFEPQHIELTAADFKDGTVTVASDDATITHSGTGFTANMVGRYFQVTDGTDGEWYKIASFTSSSSMELDKVYAGSSGGSKAFRIGQVMKIPQAYQDAPVYYALDRYYLTQSDRGTASYYSSRFDEKLKSAKKTYAHSTSQLGIKGGRDGRRATWLDLTPPVTYP